MAFKDTKAGKFLSDCWQDIRSACAEHPKTTAAVAGLCLGVATTVTSTLAGGVMFGVSWALGSSTIIHTAGIVASLGASLWAGKRISGVQENVKNSLREHHPKSPLIVEISSGVSFFCSAALVLCTVFNSMNKTAPGDTAKPDNKIEVMMTPAQDPAVSAATYSPFKS